MFICCDKSLHIREGGEELSLPKGFIGAIDDRWRDHWYIRAALSDGTISAHTPEKSRARRTTEREAET